MIPQAQQWLRESRRIAVLTGAGISAESGVPTFRGPGGLWKSFKSEDLATPGAFARDPKLVWEWYEWRRTLLAKVEPNAGHRALASLEDSSPDFSLVTQNVDGLHERSGSRRVTSIHGSIWRVRCTGCGAESTDDRVPLPKLPPLCGCGALVRPGVVWFGEPLPRKAWAEAERAVSNCDLLLVIGTSAQVYPAASLIPMAAQAGARVIEINLEETPLSGITSLSLRGKAGDILPQLIS
ncbi:MAG TPA: NAD-dependent deacylase [Bryobacteraceae bacterium]|nr:NAD-dependent deacylase [Bryobacteraceae bacterium]